MSSVIVTVPATTANIGPGFDCLGAALTLYNHFKFTPTDGEGKIIVTGLEAVKVSKDKTNLLYQSFLKYYQHLDLPPPNVEIEIELGVPLARGLGSSATAIVGGLVGANHLAGSPLTLSEVMELAIAFEGHPDNVVPALLGNCQLSVGEPGNWHICQISWHENIICVVAIPDFELSTETARSVLPNQVSRSDAIFNQSHLALLLQGLATGRADWLLAAMEDKIHQPVRKALIPGYDNVKEAAINAGAYGMVISGAGPTLLALVPKSRSSAVSKAMTDAWQKQGIKAEAISLTLNTSGTTTKLL